MKILVILLFAGLLGQSIPETTNVLEKLSIIEDDSIETTSAITNTVIKVRTLADSIPINPLSSDTVNSNVSYTTINDTSNITQPDSATIEQDIELSPLTKSKSGKNSFSKTKDILDSIIDTLSHLISEIDQEKNIISLTNINNVEEMVTLKPESLKHDITVSEIDTQVKTSKNNTQVLSPKVEKINNKVLSDSRVLEVFEVIMVLLIIMVVLLLYYDHRESKSPIKAIEITQDNLKDEVVDDDTKLVRTLEEIIQGSSIQPQKSHEIDHSLPIKLGVTIFRMRKRIMTMQESQGTKVLNKHIESLENKLNDMGYELIDLNGRQFDDGMELGQAQFIPDDTLGEGERIITRVIKPQINYNNVIIQPADVEISQGD